MFEDRCSLAPHHCAARVSGFALNVRDRVLQPPDYDGRNIVDLVDKYGDAHIACRFCGFFRFCRTQVYL